jgi:hypothetical protein
MLSEHYRKYITDFFSGIAPWEVAYKFPGLSYFAVKHEDVFVLTQARLFLRSAPSTIPATHFQSGNIRAGYYPLTVLGGTPLEVVERILSGKLPTPHGELKFSPEQNGNYSTYYSPLHHEGLQNGRRLDLLMLTGAQHREYIRQPQLDWELKAAPTPYDNLNELLFEFGLGANQGDMTKVEVIASNVAEVDLSMRIQGATAKIGLLLANGLSREKSRLGYRVFHQGRVVTRASIDGTMMHWEPQENILRGSAEIDVPEGAVLGCTATYDGYAQHQGWITDPSTVQNPYRAVYEAFDNQVTILRDFLENSQGKGRDARDLEAGVAWLLWMLGFGVAHLGGTAKTQDAPDLIATTPRGNFAVIECTTGLLKAENKLARLIERSELLRRRLDASGNRHLHVLPVIVTSKNREEIKADLEQAERLGVVVVTKESLQETLNRTLVLPDSEKIYAEAEQTAREGQEKYTQQLPFGAA